MNSKQQILSQHLSLLIIPSRIDFWAFCCYYDFEFFQKRQFLYKIARHLQRIYEGEIRTLAISMPPRAGKSYIVTLFCAWMIGQKPEGSVMRNTCTATLYNKFSYDTRDVVKSQRFKDVFPYIELSPDKQSVSGWNIKQARQVTYFGNGVGGTIIGFGASSVAITDDLFRGHEDYFSEVTREKVLRWKESSHGSRLEKHCPQIDIGTRWGNDDVIGTEMQKGNYDEVVVIPALDENDNSFCEDVKTTQEYHKIRQDIDSFIWSSEYMQDPEPLKGLVFPTLQYYDSINQNNDLTIAYADTSDEGTDFFCMPIARVINETVYIIDVIFNQDNLDANIPQMMAMIEKYDIQQLYIETNREGGMVVRELRQKTKTTIRGVHNSVNKMQRIFVQSGYIMDRFRFKDTKNDSSEYTKYTKQIKSLLKTSRSHDDAPDATAGLAMMLRRDFNL